jgi:hypothetical protein
MTPSDIIKSAFEFGTKRSENNFFSFTLKIFFFILPAIILGKFTDVFVEKLEKNKVLGETMFFYILLQTLINIVTMYLILILFSDFTSEFQVTLAGSYFIVLYFNIQTNYIDMINKYILLLSKNLKLTFRN